MLVVPISAQPGQTLNVTLNGQSCTLRIYQRRTGLYLDLSINDVLIIGGIICHDRAILVRSEYFGFSGDLAFVDTEGFEDPIWTSLGSRWILGYFTPDELVVPDFTVPLWVPGLPIVPTPTPTPPTPTPPTPTPPTPTPTPPTPTPTPPVTPGAPSGVTID